MRVTLKLLLSLFILSGTALCQERIAKLVAGPNDAQFRVVVAYMAPTETQFNMQSLIIDVNPVKNKKDLPTSYYVDITTTTRNLETGEKKQRILVIRWEKAGDVEVKCEGGRWTKENTGAELDSIVEVVKAVVQSSPLDAKKMTEFTLTKTVENKVTDLLNNLEKSKLQCVRTGS